MKPWPDDTIMVVCSRVDDPYRVEVPGAVMTRCWWCRYQILIAQDTLPRLAPLGKPHHTVCVQCAAEYHRRTGRKLRVIDI